MLKVDCSILCYFVVSDRKSNIIWSFMLEIIIMDICTNDRVYSISLACVTKTQMNKFRFHKFNLHNFQTRPKKYTYSSECTYFHFIHLLNLSFEICVSVPSSFRVVCLLCRFKMYPRVKLSWSVDTMNESIFVYSRFSIFEFKC